MIVHDALAHRAKPPVVKPEMANHSDCRNARSGSMPRNRHMAVRITVATKNHHADLRDELRGLHNVGHHMFATTLGHVQAGSSAFAEQTERQRHRMIRPKPPNRCIMKRHMLSAFDR